MFWLWFLDLMYICDFDWFDWDSIPPYTREIWQECLATRPLRNTLWSIANASTNLRKRNRVA